MKNDDFNDVYKCFDDFIDKFIIEKKSLFTKEEKIILTEVSISKVEKAFIDGYDSSSENFETKLRDQFKKSREEASEEAREEAIERAKLVFLHAEWLWYFFVSDITDETKKRYLTRFGRKYITNPIEKPTKLLGSGGQNHKTSKYYQIKFCIMLIGDLLSYQENKNGNNQEIKIEDIKKEIEETCLDVKYGEEERRNTSAITNILLYLSNPNKYEPIITDGHKKSLVKAFEPFLEDKDKESLNIDEKIKKIRDRIEELDGGKYKNFDFYDNKIIPRDLWLNPTAQNNSNLDELEALSFKKAIILYGPPGTSKTYNAKKIAKTFILQQYLKTSNKDKGVVLEQILTDSNDIVNKRIHHLQLHTNYSYENFIAGYLLKNGNMELTEGSFMKICNEVRNDKEKLPHILLLDEINRVDLSKLFGEVFSALEQRDTAISIGIDELKINIPSNLYVIGTMNEIDFSLERIDFALRRRFLWFHYEFDSNQLEEIIAYLAKEKINENEADFYQNMEQFYDNVKTLNKEISNEKDLGEKYQIGHTFFADIVEIYCKLKENAAMKSKVNTYNEAIKTLWKLSIEPILDAFLGNQDPIVKKSIIERLKKVFLP